MNALARDIIEKLIRRAETNPDRVRNVTQKIDEAEIDPLDLDEFHRSMRNAERVGGVILDWGKRDESHMLLRVRLDDLEKACRVVGRETAEVTANQSIDWILSEISDPDGWARPYVETMRTAWRRRKSAFGLSVDLPEGAIVAVKAVQAIRGRLHEGLDMRTFSRRAVGDSKAVERHLGPIVAICRLEFDLDELGMDQVLEALGLQKFPQPVLVSGDLALAGTGSSLSEISPYIGLPPAEEYAVRVSSPPAYVLTIENLASFNRYVRTVSDHGLVIYSGGYPSRPVGRFISLISEQIGEEVPWYHWGDIDADGLLILDKIRSLAGRPVLPHLMSVELAIEKGVPAAKSPRLGRLLENDHPCREIARFLSSADAHVLEQEESDPASPVPGPAT